MKEKFSRVETSIYFCRKERKGRKDLWRFFALYAFFAAKKASLPRGLG